MRQGCKGIDLGESTAIICGGEPTEHVCNDNAICYDTKTGERFFFDDSNEGHEWYQNNYEQVTCGSVACSICKRAEIDNAMWLI